MTTSRAPPVARPPPSVGESRRTTSGAEAADQLLEIVQSLGSDYDPLWGSLVKQTIRRVHPGFNESHYGYRTFSDLLEDVADRGLIKLEHDQVRGNYKVRLAGD